MSAARLAATIIYVPDVPAALEFWEGTFGLARSHLSPEGDYGELRADGVIVAFDSEALARRLGPPGGFGGLRSGRAADPPAGIELMLHVDDVRAAGPRALGSAEEKPWGQTIAYATDALRRGRPGDFLAAAPTWRAGVVDSYLGWP